MADVAALVFEIDSSQARSAASDLAKLGDASVRASGGADRLNKTLRDSSGRFKSSFDVAREYGSEVQALAAKYNPALSAVYKYQQAQVELNRAVALGVLTQKQADASLDAYVASVNSAANATQRAGQMSSFASNNIRNLGFQVNDIAMMSLTGQSLLYLIPQQGLQVVQVMNDIKASGQGLGASLKGAIGQVLNPMALLTLGTVAAGAAVIQFGASMFGASGDTKSFSDAVSDAEAAIDRINKASRALTSEGLEELRKKYGLVNDEVRRLVEQERILAIAAGAKALNAQLSAITETLGDGVFNTAYSEIERIFKVGSNEAQVLYGVLGDIKNQGTIEAQLLSITTMRDRLSAVTNGFKNMTDEQADMLEKLTISESLIRQQQNTLRQTPSVIAASTAATEAWASAMSGVLSYINAVGSSLSNISGGAIRLAAIKTETDLLRQGKTIREASLAATIKTAELEGAKRTKELEAQYGWAGKILGIAEQNQRMSIVNAEAQLDIEREAAMEREKSSSGSGSGARELAQAQKGFQSLRELMEQESLFQVAEWEKRQAQLDQALAKKLLSEQTYQEMKSQLQMMYFGTEYEKNAVNYQLDLEQLDALYAAKLLKEEQYQMQLRQLKWDYIAQADSMNASVLGQELSNWGAHFGQMNSLAGGGYDGLLRLQKSFAAASALINTWKAYTDVLASGEVMSPWAKLAWAGKILAAGMGAVNAIKGGGKGGSGSTGAASAAKAEPQRNVLVRLEGDDWLVSMAENIMTQIYDASKDGKVIIAGDF